MLRREQSLMRKNGADVNATNFGTADARSAIGRPRQWRSAVLMRTACASQINPGCAEDSCDDDVHVAVNRREGQRWGSLRSSAGEARCRRVGDLRRIRGKHRGRSGQRRRRQARIPDRMTRANLYTRRSQVSIRSDEEAVGGAALTSIWLTPARSASLGQRQRSRAPAYPHPCMQRCGTGLHCSPPAFPPWVLLSGGLEAIP